MTIQYFMFLRFCIP